ncbi:YfbM family protein [Crossiella sp. SN42]|uniref:YfbM family protein n=1 Tax=Crossiella sp. SN42 TaxID=2944808 RepID=UPI00207CF442|nr:YfbM family protein [Crossiella sp. SN42]MCO1580891.1 YfbM family protein [Crossiella sp. SN42]
MAITQQLVRIPATRLAACRQSVAALDELCSFTSTPDEDRLDLNWWPGALTRAWALAGVDARTLAVLRRGFDGDGEVNPAYREHPGTIWEHPVVALEASRVGEVAEALRAVPPTTVQAAVPSNAEEAEAALGGIAREAVGDLAGQLARQHAILRDFYGEAARRGLAVVLWWD